MPKEKEGLPPPLRGARTSPDMQEDRGGGVYDKLGQLAGMGESGEAGGEEQAAQLVMSAAQQLMQAAQIHPAIQPMIGRVLAVLKSGVDELSGGAGGEMGEEEMGGLGEMEEKPKKTPKKKRMRPPQTEPEEEEMGASMGY